MPSKPSAKSLAWPLFDTIVDQSALKTVNPWQADASFAPDYDTLRKLLAVPLLLGAESRSGVPALAVDVWVAYELRRAGLEPDAVWPRAEAPRVVDRDVLAFVRSIPKSAGRDELLARLAKGAGGVGAASANIAGKNYFKQVDVIMSSWQTGPELLISTKRMDSSFGKNAANRVEESYGDAKNLALRHPLAALGFMYALRSTAGQIAALPVVTLRTDLVPDKLGPARFFAMMLTIMFDNSNITQHEEARMRRSEALG